MFEVIWTNKAKKYYEKLNRDFQERFEKMLDILEVTPFYYGKSIKKLTGALEGFYRFRIGKLRVFYIIDTKNKNVIITNMDTRGDIY
ncbi:MAG: type II toxin-antitoxin system RelE/ParE family toxin [bacterium]